MTELQKIIDLWESIGVWDDNALLRGKTPLKETPIIRARYRDSDTKRYYQGLTGFGRDEHDWFQLIYFFASLPKDAVPKDREFSVLIWAMSVGCNLYDIAYYADQENLFEKFPNLVFYGQEISPVFTELAGLGVYPKANTLHVEDRGNRFVDRKDGMFSEIHPNIKKRTKILPTSDVRDVKRKFDIMAVGVAAGLNDDHLTFDENLARKATCARHLDYQGGVITGLSLDWHQHAKRHAKTHRYRFPEFDITMPYLSGDT